MSYIYKTAESPQVNQQGAGSVILNGKKYVFGGSTDGSSPNSLAMVYDPITDNWSYIASMPSNRWHPSVETDGTLIYIIGGKSSGLMSSVTNTVWAYNPTTDSYTTKTAMTTARSHAFSCFHNGKIYVVGGSNGTTFNTTTNECYDIASDSWSSKTSLPTGRGDVEKAPVIDGKAYFIGGYNSSSNTAVLEVYDISQNSWATSFESMSKGARDSMGVAYFDNKIWVVGGYKHSTTSRLKYIELYDVAEDAWSDGADMAYIKENPAIGVSGDSLYISHGFGENYHEVIKKVLSSVEDFSMPITGGQISSENGVITITLETQNEEEEEPEPEEGLLDGLVSYWNFSANGDDGHGSNNLTNNGSIAFTNNVANMGANKYFSIADVSQTGLDFETGVTFHFKANFNSFPTGSDGAYDIASKWVSAGNQRSFILSYRRLSSVLGFSFFVSSNGSTNEHLRKDYTLGSTGTDYQLTITWDSATKTATFYVNGQSIGTSTGNLNTMFNSNSAFLIGQQGGANYFDGKISKFLVWSRVLSSN